MPSVFIFVWHIQDKQSLFVISPIVGLLVISQFLEFRLGGWDMNMKWTSSNQAGKGEMYDYLLHWENFFLYFLVKNPQEKIPFTKN